MHYLLMLIVSLCIQTYKRLVKKRERIPIEQPRRRSTRAPHLDIIDGGRVDRKAS